VWLNEGGFQGLGQSALFLNELDGRSERAFGTWHSHILLGPRVKENETRSCGTVLLKVRYVIPILYPLAKDVLDQCLLRIS
jgi:hypothetical protein